MRVAFVTTQDRGGPVDLTVGLARALVARGVEVRIFGPPPVSSAGSVDGLVEAIEVRSKLDAGAQRRLGAQLRAYRPDVVHAQDRRAALSIAGLARVNVPRVATYHGVPDGAAKWWIGTGPMATARPTVRAASVLAADALVARMLPITVTPSRAMADFLRTRLRVPARRIRVIPNGVGVVDVPSAGLPIRTIGTVGSFTPAKSVPTLIEAFARVATIHPELRLVLAGDGPDRSHCESIVATRDLRDRVEFSGYTTDVPALLAGLDLFVLASVNENQPLALLEAMSAQRPCIASRIAAIPEALGQCGILVPPGDVTALTLAITDLVEDPHRARELARCARTRALAEYTIENAVERHVALWSELVEEHPT